MKNLLHSHHPKRHLSSFKYAFWGLKHAFLHEANFRVQVLYTVMCLLSGLYFRISYYEWIAVIISSGLLLAGEIMNTVVEEIIDHLIQEHHEGAKIIKDLCAGYVVVHGIVAFVIFLIIFGDNFLLVFRNLVL